MKYKKLMKYLNEYLIEIGRWYTVNFRNEEFKCFDDLEETWRNVNQELIICKSFKFIARLIEKDRINRYKDVYWMNFFKNWNQVFLSSEDELIMELSIQEKPMKFLSSILK